MIIEVEYMGDTFLLFRVALKYIQIKMIFVTKYSR